MKIKTSSLIWCGTILCLALFCRWPGLFQSFWLDELFSVNVAERPIAELIQRTAAQDNHPALYYLLLHYWMALGGQSEAWVRGLSVLAGLSWIAVIGLIGRQIAGNRLAWQAAALAAVTNGMCWVSYEARNYVWMNLFASLALLFLLRATERNRWYDWLLYALSLGAAFHSFYYSFYVAAGLAAAFLFLCRTPRQAILFGLASLFAGVLFVPWLPVFLDQLGRVSPHAQSHAVSGLAVSVFQALVCCAVGTSPFMVVVNAFTFFHLPPEPALYLTFVLTVLGLALCWWRIVPVTAPENTPKIAARPMVALCVLGIVFAAAVAVAGAEGVFVHSKYLMFLGGVWCVLIPIVLARLPRVLAALALVLLLSANAVVANDQARRRYHEEWREAAAFASSKQRTGDALVVVPGWADFCYLHYAGPGHPTVYGLPGDTLTPGVTPDRLRPGMPFLLPADLPGVGNVLMRHDRVWVLWSTVSRKSFVQERALLADYLAKNSYTPREERVFRHITVDLLEKARP